MGLIRTLVPQSIRSGIRGLLTRIKHKQKALPPAFDYRAKFLKQSVPTTIVENDAGFDVFDAANEYYQCDEQHWDGIRAVQFFHLVRMTSELPPGDYLECGTFRGFSAQLIWRWMDPVRDLYCIDTFEGFVAPDIAVESSLYGHGWKVGSFPPTSEEVVRRRLLDGDRGRGSDRLHVIKGWLPEAFAPYNNLRWRFVHLDMDLYKPTKDMVELLWPKIVPGGVLLLHDYYQRGFPGVKQVADDFFTPLGLRPVPLPDLGGSAVIIKPFH